MMRIRRGVPFLGSALFLSVLCLSTRAQVNADLTPLSAGTTTNPTVDSVHTISESGSGSVRAVKSRKITPGVRGGGVRRYIGTHKLLLLTDAALVLSSLADSATTVHCMQVSRFCSEENPLLPRHPSPAQVYGLKLGMTVGIVAWNHFYEHKAQQWGWSRPLYVAWTIPLVTVSIAAAHHNVQFANQLSSAQAAARTRLLTDPVQ